MRIVVFGLAISSSWGNGHATLWRGLARALAEAGHSLVFFERDVPWYAGNRDLHAIPGGELVLYRDWREVRSPADAAIREADAAMVTSFCPDAAEATALVLAAPRALRVFYDLDTPVTLERLGRGDATPVGPTDLSGFDLVLSFTAGPVLSALRERLGARRVAPLYGHADPAVYRPVAPAARFAADLSYIGTWAADRQAALDALFIEPARRQPERRFVLAGAQYPEAFRWADNVAFVHHLGPAEHAAFYAASRLTLNVTRSAMVAAGWCPSGRLFEAAACGTAILSDTWEGIETFFEPGREILLAARADDVLAALDLPAERLARIGREARDRVLAQHTSRHRVDELVTLLEAARGRTVEA